MEKVKELNLKDAFLDFKDEKNIGKEVMQQVIKDVFLTQLAKTYGTADNFDVIVNLDKGNCEIYQQYTIVEEEDLFDESCQMTLEDLAEIDPVCASDYEVGDLYSKSFPLSEFGRRGILNIRQNLQGRIMDIEKANVYKKYYDLQGELFTGEIYQTWQKEALILDEDGNELHIPKAEQIPGERFKKSQVVSAIIDKVEMKNNTTPYITLSRTSDLFLQRLFETKIQEIKDGLITIKKVVRVPGERAKVAVESYDDRIDAIGACIGVKGGRIGEIIKNLGNENIDVIQWSNNPKLMIQRALNPGVVSYIEMTDNPNDKVKVFMQPDQVSKGIGRHGVNVTLAGYLVDREIEVFRELPKGEEIDEEDVLLSEFADVIDTWVIERLESIGCDTAKSVLAFSQEDIAKRSDLEEETVAEVFSILQAEFEE